MEQMYLTTIRARKREGGAVEKRCYLMQGGSLEDIERKLRYTIDLTEFVEFSITSAKRVKPNMHLLWSRVTQPESPGHVVNDGQDNGPSNRLVSAGHRTNQPGGRGMFAFALIGRIFAKTESQAKQRAALFLQGSADGVDTICPFADGWQMICEEEAESDSTRTWDILDRAGAHHVGKSRTISGGRAGG